jgi:hypothetical protein
MYFGMHEILLFVTKAVLIQFKDVWFLVFKVIIIVIIIIIFIYRN